MLMVSQEIVWEVVSSRAGAACRGELITMPSLRSVQPLHGDAKPSAGMRDLYFRTLTP